MQLADHFLSEMTVDTVLYPYLFGGTFQDIFWPSFAFIHCMFFFFMGFTFLYLTRIILNVKYNRSEVDIKYR